MLKFRQVLGLGALAAGLFASMAWAAEAQNDLPGPIDSLQDFQDTGKMLFKLADDNNDGQISQQEAIDVGNLLVGGYFFRADANGDGMVTKAEMQAARDKILAEKPILRVLMSRTQQNPAQPNAAGNARGAAANATNAAQGVLSLLDSNNDGNIQANEMKQMVQTTVQSTFAAADTNRDGQLSPSEVNAAMVGMAKSAGQAAFQRADTNNDNQISREEFDKALIEPANTIFQVVDANNDGKISPQEFQAAQRFVASQVRALNMPEPANSPRNLLRTGRAPGEVAPVPNFATNPARPGQTPPPAAVQPVAPAPR